jgi:hypothetical protein
LVPFPTSWFLINALSRNNPKSHLGVLSNGIGIAKKTSVELMLVVFMGILRRFSRLVEITSFKKPSA